MPRVLSLSLTLCWSAAALAGLSLGPRTTLAGVSVPRAKPPDAASLLRAASVPIPRPRPAPERHPANDTADVRELREALRAQSEQMARQIAALEARAQELGEQQAALAARQRELAGAQPEPVLALAMRAGRGAPARIDAAEDPEEPVGNAPEPDSAPPIAALADRGGVLTPRGVLTIEPELEFSSSSLRRFDFQGLEVASSVLVGEIDAQESERDTYTSALSARYGLAERLELSLKVPYVRREDRITSRIVSQGQAQGSGQSRDGSGLGDVEVGLHYQLAHRASRWPFVVGNLRIKSDTGTSPFEVSRALDGTETELATGSGAWSIEPSLTFIYPTDPAVLYGSASYAYSVKQSVGKTVNSQTGPVRIGDVDLGDSVGLSFGVGLSLNETTSLSLGYSHQYLMRSSTEIDGQELESSPFHVGEFQFGLSYQLAPRSSVQLTLSVGVTESAPDVRMGLRVPMTWRLLE